MNGNSLNNDRIYILKLVRENGINLQYASEELKDDEEIVKIAVNNNSLSLKYASDRLRDNEEVVLDAIKEFVDSYEYASDRLKNDRSFVLKAKWVYDISCDYYCNQTGKNFEQLKQDDENIIWKYASSELVFILTWLIKNDLYDKEELSDYEQKIQEIKNSNILATDIIESIDYTLCDEFSNDIVPFFKNNYINYENFTRTILGKEPYSFIGTYDDYLKFEKMIDKKYSEYKNNFNK